MKLIDAIRKERIKGGLGYCFQMPDAGIVSPFVPSHEIASIAGRLNVFNRFHTARNIFGWMIANISYIGDERYRNSAEVFEEKTGNCAEQAFLYITMARCAGLKAGFVDVSIDNEGKRVRHACSYAGLERSLLVDTAYRAFDINHRKYRLLDDDEIFRIYTYFREMQ